MDREIGLFRSGGDYPRWIVVMHHQDQRMVHFPNPTRSKETSTYPLYLTLPNLPLPHLLPRITTAVRLRLQPEIQHPLLTLYHLNLVILDLSTIDLTFPIKFLPSTIILLPFCPNSVSCTSPPRPFITPPITPFTHRTRTIRFPSSRSIRFTTIRRSCVMAPLDDPSRQNVVSILD